MNHYRIIIAGVLFALLGASAHAGTNVWFIMDASGSMAGKVEGTAKIDIAKQTLTKLVGEIPNKTNLALVAYGETKKDDCNDIHALTNLIGADKRGEVTSALDGLKPLGKTPIAKALEFTGNMAAEKHSDDSNTIVLISDGIETCDGDPCAVAGKLAAGNVKIKTHVVGFNVSAKTRKQLECIVEKGQGKYFSADSTSGFKDAVGEAVKLAQAAAPPPKPVFKEIFRDDFEGDKLASHWKVVNADEDSYIVEDGKLLIVAGAKGGLRNAKTPNLFTLDTKLPKGDWVMTARVSVEVQTFREKFALGVYDSNKKSVAAVAYVTRPNSVDTDLWLSSQKVSRGKVKLLNVLSLKTFGGRKKFVARMKLPVELQLAKTGRKYQARIRWPDDPKLAKWAKAGEVTLLRASGKPFFAAYQNDDVKGESPFKVDWVKIEVPAKPQ